MNKQDWAIKNIREYFEKETQIVKVDGRYIVMNKYNILRQKIQEFAARLAAQANEDKKYGIAENSEINLAKGRTKQRICDDLLDILQSIV